MASVSHGEAASPAGSGEGDSWGHREDFAIELSGDGIIVWVAPEVTSVLGWSPTQMAGRPLAHFVRDPFSPMQDGGLTRLRFRCADAVMRWASARCRAIPEGAGRQASWSLSLRDISAQVFAEQLGAQAQEMFRATANVLPEPLYLFTAVRDAEGVVVDLRYEYLNSAAERLYGRPASEVLGATLTELFPSVVELGILGCYIEPFVSGQPASMRVPFFDENQVSGAFEVTSSPAGKYVVVTARDVTAQLAAQAALEESEDRFRLLAENASDVVVLTSPGELITWVAPSVARTLGWEPTDLVATALEDIVHPQDVAAYLAGRAASATHTSDVPAIRVRNRDGEYRWMSGTVAEVTRRSGARLGWATGLRDVDDLIKAREAAQAGEARRKATQDSLLDPHVVLRAMRGASGQIVDFEYTDANDAACAYNQVQKSDLIGATLLEMLPGHVGSGLLKMYADVIESDTPLVLDDYEYPNEILASRRRYDIRAVRVGDSLSYTWRDVTDRHNAQLAEAEARYRTLAENVSDVAMVGDLAGNTVWISQSITSLSGWLPEDLVGRRVDDFLHPDDLAQLADIRAAMSQGKTAVTEVRLRTSDGSYRWIEVHARPVVDTSGAIVGRAAGLHDIDDAHRAKMSLADSEQRFRLLAENASDMVYRTNAAGAFDWVSPSARVLLGRDPEDLVSWSAAGLIHPEDIPAELAEAMPGGPAHALHFRARLLHSDGSYRWTEVRDQPVLDEAGVVVARVGGVRDIGGQVEAEQELVRRAVFDDLTGVLRREPALERLEAINSDRRSSATACGVLFCDVDDLKAINQDLGHVGGDEVLGVIASRIRNSTRAADVVARLGGDEFLVILDGVHDLAEAVGIAEKIRRAVAEPIALPDGIARVTVSIGVTLGLGGESSDALIRRSDAAMYLAKGQGRDRVVAYEPG